MQDIWTLPSAADAAPGEVDLLDRAHLLAASNRDLDLAVERLTTLLAHTASAPFAGTYTFAGTYVGWLARVVCLAHRSMPPTDADGLLRACMEAFARGGRLIELERRLAPHMVGFRMGSTVFPPNVSARMAARLRALDLSYHARGALTWFVYRCEHPRGAVRFIADDALARIEEEIALHREAIDAALRRAPSSPLGGLRVAWTCGVLGQGDLVSPKLAELLDPDTVVHPVGSTPRAAESDGQRVGWVRDARLGGWIRRLSAALAAHDHEVRRARTLATLRNVAAAQGSLRDRVLEAFVRLGDRRAVALVDDVSRGKLEFAVLAPDEFARFVIRTGSPLQHRLDRIGALYTPRDGIRGRTGPSIVLKINDRERCPVRLLHMCAMAVHEHEHFVHFGVNEKKTRDDMVRGEMLSYVREALWLAEHGWTDSVDRVLRGSCQGYGAALRADLEHRYITRRLGIR